MMHQTSAASISASAVARTALRVLVEEKMVERSAELGTYFLGRLQQFQDINGSVLDHSIVMYGSGASTTHNPTNLPTLIAGGANMGLKHGTHWRKPNTPMSNLYLSILRSMKIEEPSFSDSTGVLQDSVFTQV